MAIEEGEAVMMAVLVSFVDEDPLHSSTTNSMGSSSSSGPLLLFQVESSDYTTLKVARNLRET